MRFNDGEDPHARRRFPPEWEAEFRAEYLRNSLLHLRWSVVLGCALMAGLGAVHIATDPTTRMRVADGVAYFGLTCPLYALLFGLSYTRVFLRIAPLLTAVALVLPALFFIVPGTMSLSGICMWIICSYTLARLRFAHAVGVGLLLSGVYLVGLFQTDPVDRAEPPGFACASVAVANFIGALSGRSIETYLRRDFLLARLLTAEHQKSEHLLRNILPAAVAERLKRGPGVIADSFDEVSVLFADLVGFTEFSSRARPAELVGLLNDVFSLFDSLAAQHGLEKVKTVGDAYMAAAGVPTPCPGHAQAAVELALEMQAAVRRLNAERSLRVRLRIGVSTGPVIAGVIGASKLAYDLWGDTVNTASRMQVTCPVDAIQVTEQTAACLGGGYQLDPQPRRAVHGKGEMATYLVRGRREASAVVGARV